jgi:hypothetical protein
MKTRALLFSFALLLGGKATAQQYSEIGIDFDNALIWAAGGDRDYSELEILYRECSPEGDLRFRLSLLNRNFYLSELAATQRLDTSFSHSLLFVQYEPRLSYVAGMGISRYMKGNKLPVYYGADVNLGVSRGYMNSYTVDSVEEIPNTDRFVGSKGNHWLILGMTPFLGLKKQLSERLTFGIEFGLPMTFVWGEVNYFDENQETVSSNFSAFEFGFPKFINDLTIFYRLTP